MPRYQLFSNGLAWPRWALKGKAFILNHHSYPLSDNRIRANDRIDPYVAVYTCPEPNEVGDVTHFRWSGFLSPDFVQDVINAALYDLSYLFPAMAVDCPTRNLMRDSSKSGPDHVSNSFIVVTVQGIPSSPVSYLPPNDSNGAKRAPPPKLRQIDGEDTYSLLLTPGIEPGTINWALAESIGHYDARWG